MLAASTNSSMSMVRVEFELHRASSFVLVEQHVLVLRDLEALHQVRALDRLAGAGIDGLHADAVVGVGIDQVEVHVGGTLGGRVERHRAGHQRQPQMAFPTSAASPGAAMPSSRMTCDGP